ncbi:MAG: hypothetical protein KGO02_24125, partial [Alphaproteobacteria bacterium]|nr:hypothetical protein [Alphaproteobacteria bacterium]
MGGDLLRSRHFAGKPCACLSKKNNAALGSLRARGALTSGAGLMMVRFPFSAWSSPPVSAPLSVTLTLPDGKVMNFARGVTGAEIA